MIFCQILSRGDLTGNLSPYGAVLDYEGVWFIRQIPYLGFGMLHFNSKRNYSSKHV